MINVIVIEDDNETLEVFCEYLSLKNINVVGTANNGKDAVKIFNKVKPDLVILDIMMPEYDGFYALENIKKINPEAKIIAITADTTSTTTKRMLDANIASILYKPYDLEYVIQRINEVCNDHVDLVKKIT